MSLGHFKRENLDPLSGLESTMMQLRDSLQSPDPPPSSPVHPFGDGHAQKDFTLCEPWERALLKTSSSPSGSLLWPPAISVMDLLLCLATPSASPLLPGVPISQPQINHLHLSPRLRLHLWGGTETIGLPQNCPLGGCPLHGEGSGSRVQG